MQPDQQLMVRLAQAIQGDQTAGPRNGLRVLILLLEEQGETVQGVGDLPSITFAQRREPVVVERRQEVVFIELRRGCEGLHLPGAVLLSSRGGGIPNRRLKIDGVHGAGSISPPLNREMIGPQQLAFARQGSFQIMEKLPQIRPRLRFAGCRPQDKSQSLARLRHIPMKDQICHQRLETVGVDGRDQASHKADPQVTEQADPHGC
jgi:hypothetical protein